MPRRRSGGTPCDVALHAGVFPTAQVLGRADSHICVDELSNEGVDVSNGARKRLIGLGHPVRCGPSSRIVGRRCHSAGVVPIGPSIPRTEGALRPAGVVLLAKRGDV